MKDAMLALDRDGVAARVAGFPRVAADLPELKQAAVAVCVTQRERTPTLLLTRRAAQLRAHAGQWALPGGRRDDGETAVLGALRELAEEVGLSLDGIVRQCERGLIKPARIAQTRANEVVDGRFGCNRRQCAGHVGTLSR